MHHAAAAFQAQNHFVLGGRHAQQCGHLMTQVIGGGCLDVAIEVQHVDALFLQAFLLRLLGLLGFCLVQGLELVLVQHGVLQPLTQLLVEVVQLAHLQMTAACAPAAPTQGSPDDEHHDHRYQHGERLGQETCVIG
ncbi:hypothetical protein D3C81_1785110 [compost metagenome]